MKEVINMIKAWILMLVILSSSVLANTENVINVDRAIPNSLHLAFPNDANITPKKGDFNVLNYILMSNNEGERWAVITLTNLSTGNRELNEDHLLALFADGTRLPPQPFKLSFKGNETQSVTVSFAEYKFPILSVYSSNAQ